MRLKLITIALLLFGVATTIACSIIASDSDQECWNQFRGNNRNGASTIKTTSQAWPNKDPELKWNRKIGSAFSEILVSKERVFTMSSEITDSISGSELIVAFDITNGNEVWRTVIDSMFRDSEGWGDGPRATPAMDGQAIYCLSSFGKLRALSQNKGDIIWTVDFEQEFDNKPGWIYTSSPLLLDDEIIIEVGGTESRGFASIDKKTGKTNWIKGEGVHSYSSPTLALIDDKSQTIFANGINLFSIDKDGNEIWSYEMPFQAPIATPLFIAPNKVFVSSGRGCFMIKIENNQANEVFKKNSMRNTFSTSCYYNGHIYGISNGGLKCISAIDGESKWAEKGFGLGNIILVGNKILALSDKGVLKIVDAFPDAYNENFSIQAITGKSWTAPSFANGIVYLRNLNEMVSFKLD